MDPPESRTGFKRIWKKSEDLKPGNWCFRKVFIPYDDHAFWSDDFEDWVPDEFPQEEYEHLLQVTQRSIDQQLDFREEDFLSFRFLIFREQQWR